MIRLLLTASIYIRDLLRCYMPSNVITDMVRTRRGLKWGIPTMLLAVPYLGVAYWCTSLLDAGGPGWLNLVVLICVWSGLKMLWLGPISLVLLIRARTREFVARRRDRKEEERAGTRDATRVVVTGARA